MRILSLLTVCLFLSIPRLIASEKPLSQNSKIEKVTVFLQGATVER